MTESSRDSERRKFSPLQLRVRRTPTYEKPLAAQAQPISIGDHRLRGDCGASRQDGPIEVVGLCKGSKMCPADTTVIKKDSGVTENKALERRASRCRTRSLRTASQTDDPMHNGES